MARRRHRRSNRDFRRSAGAEAAARHMEERRQLSNELGGTDKDVEDYFLSLSGDELREVLDEYSCKFGADAGEYAESTFDKWRSGYVRMSGLVATRLFELLPSFMPLAKKYDLVKSLWEHVGPSSNYTLYVGSDASPEELCRQVRDHLDAYVTEYTIPDMTARRFSWLAENDVDLQQSLHNYFLQLNKDDIATAANDRLPMLMQQFQNAMSLHTKSTQTVQVARHRITVICDPNAQGISTTPPRSKASGSGCAISIAIIMCVVTLAVLPSVLNSRAIDEDAARFQLRDPGNDSRPDCDFAQSSDGPHRGPKGIAP